MTSQGFKTFTAENEAEPSIRLALLTDAALLLAIALAVVRATMLEYLRSPFAGSGNAAAANDPGPTTTLTLNLLCFLPALFVLARRSCDANFRLAAVKSWWIFVALTAWTAMSTAWSSDKFSAAVAASTWAAAGALGWATTQTVRDAGRLRWVTGALAGLLLIFVVQAALYHFVDAPETAVYWQTHREETFRQMGWDEDSMIAKQYERKVLAGELVGFTLSSNSFAAVLSLTAFTTLGAALQRWRDGSKSAALALSVVLALGLVVLVGTQSRTAQTGFALCAGAAAVVYRFRRIIASRLRLSFSAGIATVLAGGAAVIAVGTATGGLVHPSLTFRWNYWVASYALFKANFSYGVGWTNFGPSYLRYRLPQAAEEIRDPHNLLIHFATETGVVGLALVLAWLLRSVWELMPRAPHFLPNSSGAQCAGRTLPVLIAIVGLWLTVGSLAAVDLSNAAAAFELLKRCLFAACLAAGVALVLCRQQAAEVGTTPARFIATSFAVAVAGFVLHSMVDFAFFETGPMFLFFLVAGTSLGMSGRDNIRRPGSRWWPRLGMLAVTTACIGFTVFFIVPVGSAEAAAKTADALIGNVERQSALNPAAAGRDVAIAATLYRSAFDVSPVSNADYAVREAEAWRMLSDHPDDVLAAYARAIAADPLRGKTRLDRARQSIHDRPANIAAIDADYAAALDLNPKDLNSRYEYASWLASIGQTDRAREQYRRVLETNDGFDAAEPKRLSEKKRAEVKEKAV